MRPRHQTSPVQVAATNNPSVWEIVAHNVLPLIDVEAQVDGVTSNGAGRKNVDRHGEREIHADEQGMSTATEAVDSAHSPGVQIYSV